MLANRKIDFTKARARQGFTLLEVMLATFIFSVVVTAIYMSFYVGTNAYQATDEKKNLLQEARFCFQFLQRDINTIYYLPETMYNTNIRREMQRLEQMRMQAEELGIPVDEYIQEQLEKELGRISEAERDERESSRGDENPFDPYNYGVPVDLTFTGTDGGDTDSFEFVRYQYSDGIVKSAPWSLERIRYFVEDDVLLRERKLIFLPPRDKEGNPIPTPESPVEVLAEGVEVFDVSYGYFYEGQWLESPDWNSEERKYRNPMPELDPEEPDYLQRLKREKSKPVDGLPGYLFVKIKLIEPEKGERSMQFQTLINVAVAQENNIPVYEEEEEGY